MKKIEINAKHIEQVISPDGDAEINIQKIVRHTPDLVDINDVKDIKLELDEINQLKGLIAKAKIKEVFMELEKNNDIKVNNTYINLSSRFVGLQLKHTENRIDHTSYEVGLQNIIHGILSFLDNISKSV
ncbi:MAG: hypothetical protein ACPGJS_04885 [Flammeovirgaceae bacterium]